jgi:hypothetical protein
MPVNICWNIALRKHRFEVARGAFRLCLDLERSLRPRAIGVADGRHG